MALKDIISKHTIKNLDKPYYKKSFIDLTTDYLWSKGKFTNEDKKFLAKNGYTENDFELI